MRPAAGRVPGGGRWRGAGTPCPAGVTRASPEAALVRASPVSRQGEPRAPVVGVCVITDRLTTCGAGERSERNGVSAYTASETAAITIRARKDSTIRARRDLISAARPGRPNDVSLDAI